METDKTLRKMGYTGDIYILIDDEDDSAGDYQEKFGDKCLTFCKKEAETYTDTADQVKHRKAVVFARNAVFDVVKNQTPYTYFLVLDDDYKDFRCCFNEEFKFIYSDFYPKQLDNYFRLIFEYFASIPAETLSLSQTGDYFGGKTGSYADAIKTKRKVMNSFFCSTERPFKFFGRINEDVNYYVHDGRQGKLVFQTNQMSLLQGQTQANSGGLTDIYKSLGTYVKSFYSVMFSPSCVTVNEMGRTDRRLHHKVDWNYSAPKIISERFKK
jgi:hypothetical protein